MSSIPRDPSSGNSNSTSSDDPAAAKNAPPHGLSSSHGSSAPPDVPPPSAEEESAIVEEVVDPTGAPPTLPQTVKTLLIGRARDLKDNQVFQHVSLVAFLAWVGLGADGLSSSCYGPSEAFIHLKEHAYLAIFLSLATIATVIIISACYSHIIEEFPSGGGGYLVASKLLGRPAGVTSGSALLVDYVLTITVSIAAMGDALFGLLEPDIRDFHLPQKIEKVLILFLGTDLLKFKLPFEAIAILALILLNLRGIKESVKVLVPIFMIFLVTHALLITGSLAMHATAVGEVATSVVTDMQKHAMDPKIGILGLIAIFLRAYSMGAGTYTGIEAVSNSMPVMREPRVATAKRTMIYMALSLAFTAGGLMVAYLLLGIQAPEGTNKTMNLLLTEKFVSDSGLNRIGIGSIFLWVTIISEGALLFVAAQAGFIDGPRVLANMSQDSYMPHMFSNLSERLSAHNGVYLMGFSALAALCYTGGKVESLVIMYSINVFLTFSLSMIGMTRHWWQLRGRNPIWKKRLATFVFGSALCLAILAITVYEKFAEGGYVTIAVTGACVALCFMTRRYYDKIGARVAKLNSALKNLPTRPQDLNTSPPDPNAPTAIVLVGGYGGLGIHTMMNTIRMTPGHFKNFVFISVGVVDSGNFKGIEAMEDLKKHTEDALTQYVDLANRLGFPSTSFMAIGTDAVDELEHLCVTVYKRFPKGVIFAGQLIFSRDALYQRLFHNQTAFSLQRRMQWDGIPMVILPTRVR